MAAVRLFLRGGVVLAPACCVGNYVWHKGRIAIDWVQRLPEHTMCASSTEEAT